MLDIKSVDGRPANSIMLCNPHLAAAGCFEVPGQLNNLLLSQLGLGAEFYTTRHCLFSTLHGPLPDQFPFKLANGGQNVELQPAIHGGRVDHLVKDHQVDLFYLKRLNNASQIHDLPGEAVKFCDYKDVTNPHEIECVLEFWATLC